MSSYTNSKAFRTRLFLRAFINAPNAHPADLAALAHIARNTAAGYCDHLAQAGLDPSHLLTLTDSELCSAMTRKRRNSWLHPIDEDEMKYLRKKGWNKKQCYKRYLQSVPEGARAMAPRTFREHLQGAEHKDPSMKLVFVAGDVLMADYSGDKIKAISPFGHEHAYSIFVATLPCSQWIFAAVHEFERVEDWIGGLTDAIHACAGVPRRLVPDNPKALVLKPRRGATPAVLNPAFSQLCHHYQCIGDPARSGAPTDKSLVETAVNLIQTELNPLLNVRSRLHYEDLTKLLAQVVDEINNRPMEKRQKLSRMDWFEKTDATALKPLSMKRHQYIALDNTQIVSKQYRVSLEGSTYSVPHAFIGHQAYITMTRTMVDIFIDGKLVATHPRARRPGLDLLIDAHMPAAHRARHYQQEGHILAWAEGLSEEVRAVVEFNLAAPAPGAAKTQRMQGLQKLQEDYGPDRLIAACTLAVANGRMEYRRLKSLLENGRDLTAANVDVSPIPTIPVVLDNVRGTEYYARRQA